MSSTEASASSRARAVAGREPADGRRQVATADAQGVGDPDAGAVEQAEQLLAAGPGRGHDAHRTGGRRVGEAQAEPADDGGAAVGAHHEHAALGGGPLEGDLLRDGHVVAEDHHVAAGVDGVHRLDQRARPGDRDEHQRRRRCRAGRWRSCAAARRSAAADGGAAWSAPR